MKHKARIVGLLNDALKRHAVPLTSSQRHIVVTKTLMLAPWIIKNPEFGAAYASSMYQIRTLHWRHRRRLIAACREAATAIAEP